MTLCMTCVHWRECRALPADGACAGYVQGEAVLADKTVVRKEAGMSPGLKDRLVEGLWGPWTENKLLSRKWLTVVGVVGWALLADALGHPLADSTVSVIQWVVPPWITIQGAVDWWKYRQLKALGEELFFALRKAAEEETGGGDGT